MDLLFPQSRACGASGLCYRGGGPPLSLSSPPGTRVTLHIGLHPIYQPSRRALDALAAVPRLGILLSHWFQRPSPQARLEGLVHLEAVWTREGSCSQRAEPGQVPGFDDNVIKKAVTLVSLPPPPSSQSCMAHRTVHLVPRSHHLLVVVSLRVSGICSVTFPAAPGLLFVLPKLV